MARRAPKICYHCGWRPARARGLCAADYSYLAKYGALPEELVLVQRGQRDLERLHRRTLTN